MEPDAIGATKQHKKKRRRGGASRDVVASTAIEGFLLAE
jgi:hypothetical protein